MKIEILVGSNYPDGDEEVRVEAGDVVEVSDKIAKSLIKNKDFKEIKVIKVGKKLTRQRKKKKP